METESVKSAAGEAADAEAAATVVGTTGKGKGDAAAKEEEETRRRERGAAAAAGDRRRDRGGGMDLMTACSTSRETQEKLQRRLREASVPADVFWRDLHAHAAKTCGGSKNADAVVAAFKTIHAKRLAKLNLEQTDALCKDVLTLLLRQP